MFLAWFGGGDDGAGEGVFVPVVESDAPVGMQDDRFSFVLTEVEPNMSGYIGEFG